MIIYHHTLTNYLCSSITQLSIVCSSQHIQATATHQSTPNKGTQSRKATPAVQHCSTTLYYSDCGTHARNRPRNVPPLQFVVIHPQLQERPYTDKEKGLVTRTSPRKLLSFAHIRSYPSPFLACQNPVKLRSARIYKR